MARSSAKDELTTPSTLVTDRPDPATLAQPLASLRPALQVVGGTDFGAVFPFPDRDGDVILGRTEDSAIQLNDPSVSRRHVRFTVERRGDRPVVYAEDLGSTNGTQLDWKDLAGRTQLDDGARIRVGDIELRYRVLDGDDLLFQRGLSREAVAGQRDALTGLYSRRWLTDRLPGLIATHRRNRVALSCMLVDIDHFKQVNDRLGHVAGDSVLFRVAEALRNCMRGADIAVRYGGEEFCVVLPGASAEVATRVAERARAQIAGMRVELRGAPEHRSTVSVGVAELDRDEALSDWIDRADRALYQAKACGRDRVVTAPPGSTDGADTCDAVATDIDFP
jgi:diguanylate cyclase (GGDEF)-like protein